MRTIWMLVKRHMLLFFNDKTSVFFSFMAVFIVLFLYIAFLGDMMMKPLKLTFPDTARELSDSWIMAGTLGIISLTSSLSVLGIIIEDKSRRIHEDFQIAPIPSFYISISYIFSTILITMIISCITLGIAELYIVAYGGQWLTIYATIRVFGCMMLSILSCTLMLYFIMSFFHSASSFSNVTTIIGTLSGFLMGIYVPIGSLPNFLQTIITWFPPSHSAALFREIMMDDVMERSFVHMNAEAIQNFKQQFGLTFMYGDHVSKGWEHIIILVIFGMLFLIIIRIQQRRK